MTSASSAQGGPLPASSHAEDAEDNKSVASSDGENQKVREKLKKTSIAPGKGSSKGRKAGDAEDSLSDESMASSPTSTSGTKRTRKRSRDLEAEDDEPDVLEDYIDENGNKVQRPAHRRKRSRDRDLVSEEGGASKNGQSTTPKDGSDEELPDAKITSPRATVKKRAREDLEPEEDADSDAGAAQDIEDKGVTSRPMSRNFTEEHAAKRIRESPEAESKKLESPSSDSEKKGEAKPLPLGSGFANTSVSSPFATAGASGKSIFGSGAANPPAGKDLFGASKFGALSGSSASPFATTANPSASPFASIKSNASPFASAGSSSPFASLGAKPMWGSGTSKGLSFGAKTESPKPFVSKKPAKPFGAPDTDDEGDDSGASGDEVDSNDNDDEKEKEREKERKLKLVEQEVNTGEEEETTIFSFRAKIFVFDKDTKSWKERGMGNIHLNTSIPDEKDLNDDKTPKRRVRLIGRADATYRVILNIPLTKSLINLYGDKGKEPSGTAYNVVGQEDGVNRQFIIKTKQAKDLHEHITEALDQ